MGQVHSFSLLPSAFWLSYLRIRRWSLQPRAWPSEMIMSCEKKENHFFLISSVSPFPSSPSPSIPQPLSNENPCLHPFSKLWHIFLSKPQKERKGNWISPSGVGSGRESYEWAWFGWRVTMFLSLNLRVIEATVFSICTNGGDTYSVFKDSLEWNNSIA